MLGMAWFEATHGPLLAIIVLAIVATCFSAFFGPTMGSYLPVMVRDETELGPANSAWATLDNLAFIIGPAIGGLLIAAGGLTLAFLLNAASFAVIAVVLWRLPSGVGATSSDGGPESRPASEVEPASSTRGPSLRTIFRMQRLGLSGLLIIAAVGNFVYGGLAILTVVLATDVYRGGDSATGYLNAAIGVGGVLGAIASGPLPGCWRRTPGRRTCWARSRGRSCAGPSCYSRRRRRQLAPRSSQYDDFPAPGSGKLPRAPAGRAGNGR